MTEIIDADHDHHDFGVDAVELSIGNAPENFLGCLSAHPEVERLPGSEAIIGILAFPRPKIGDRVSDQHNIEIVIPFLDLPHEVTVTAFFNRGDSTLGGAWCRTLQWQNQEKG